MSDTKHNLLHLLKIITAPLLLVAGLVIIIELFLLFIFEACGFRTFSYDSLTAYVIEKWQKLP